MNCDCVPGHRCDCVDVRRLLIDILTNAEYEKVAAEGRAADALELVWDEHGDAYIAPNPDGTFQFEPDHFTRLAAEPSSD